MNRDDLKPSKTYDELISIMESRGLNIPDRQRAGVILRSYGYYRLSAYFLGLKDENNIFNDGVSIEQINAIYNFDVQLRHLLFSVIEPLEIRLRSEIAYLLATSHGNVSHLDPKLTKSNKKFLNVLSTYYKGLEKHHDKPFISHHVKQYGELPVWAAVETFTFGTLSMYYGILNPTDAKIIATAFHSDVERLPAWFESLCEIRNACAHADRIYNRNLKIEPKLYSEDQKYAVNSQNKLFKRLIIIKRMYKGSGQWLAFYNNLKKQVEKYQNHINLSCLGFPKYWQHSLDSINSTGEQEENSEN